MIVVVPPKGRGDGTRGEGVVVAKAVALGAHVDVAVHGAGQDQPAGGVDPLPPIEPVAERDDAPVPHRDIAIEAAGTGYDAAVGNHQIMDHRCLPRTPKRYTRSRAVAFRLRQIRAATGRVWGTWARHSFLGFLAEDREWRSVMSVVPVIDLSAFLGGGGAARRDIAELTDRTCREISFLCVTGHRVPQPFRAQSVARGTRGLARRLPRVLA